MELVAFLGGVIVVFVLVAIVARGIWQMKYIHRWK